MVGAPPISSRPAELVREAAMPYRSVFDVVWSGRRHIMMMASQIDRNGNQNISAVGPHDRPKVQLVGVRGAPGNSVNHPTSYWVPDHSPRDLRRTCRCRVRRRVRTRRGRRVGRPALPRCPPRRLQPRRVRLRDARPHHAAAARYHPGVTIDDIIAATGFELDRGRRRGRDAPADTRRARPHPHRARPGLAARPRGADLTGPGGTGASGTAAAPRPAHRVLRTGRRALPVGADRHGLGGRAPTRRRHLRSRRAGRPRLGHDDPRPAGGGHRRGAQPDLGALRGQPPHRRGRRGGPDRPR